MSNRNIYYRASLVSELNSGNLIATDKVYAQNGLKTNRIVKCN